jgi:hypothetical protein
MTLPKFLLAWSDFNWLWIYDRLRPALTERWTLLRVLALAVLFGGLGALFGVVFGLAIFRQPVGWLPWLLGLMGLCVGLCWFSVTALCWNQRAAQLRAIPALPIGLPKARYPFFRWCLGLCYFLILGQITPFALVVTVENIRGEITWKREHARLVAAGEKLTFRDILGPEIPASQNAGAAMVFAAMFDYEKQRVTLPTGEKTWSTVWPQSNAWAQFQLALLLPSESLKSSTTSTPAIDLEAWSQSFRKMAAKPMQRGNYTSSLTLPPPGDAALDVLAGVAPADTCLNEICAAATLVHCRFPIHWDDAFQALLPHVSELKSAQINLQLRCAAHLAAGRPDAAFADATNALNVAELLREEPLLISQLVRYAQLHIAVNTLWQGLAGHQWSDPQLESFQRRLAQVDCLPGLLLAYEGERVLGIASLDLAIRDPQVFDSFMGGPPGGMPFLRVIPRSIMRQNQVAILRFATAKLERFRNVLAEAPQTGLCAAIRAHVPKLEDSIPQIFSPYTQILNAVAPATDNAINKTGRAQTTIQLAIVACALERYRLAQGTFPEKLDQLAPRFLSNVPLDPMIDQPFHYQRTDDGWFLLYSVGLNGTDDGGEMTSGIKGDKEENDWPWPVPSRPAKQRLF